MTKQNDEMKQLLEQNQQLIEELKQQRAQPVQVELPQMSFWERVREYGIFAATWHIVGIAIHAIFGALFE